jgi:hypothetical protein
VAAARTSPLADDFAAAAQATAEITAECGNHEAYAEGRVEVSDDGLTVR